MNIFIQILIVAQMLPVFSQQTSNPVSKISYTEPTCLKDNSCEYRECQNIRSSRMAYYFSVPMELTCDPDFIHAKGRANTSSNPATVRLGSFNLYHLGYRNGNEQFKRLDIIARMMNERWDLVAAQELMPLRTEEVVSNDLIDLALQNKLTIVPGPSVAAADVGLSTLPSHYTSAGYFELLVELQKLDPSWSLIVSTVPKGDDAYLEMSGFYYRNGPVSANNLKYCDGKPGCSLKLSEDFELAVARPPFLANFSSGQFASLYASAHLRFNPPIGENAAQINAIFQSLYDKECAKKRREQPRFCRNEKINKEYFARFAEARIVSDEIFQAARISGAGKWMLSGDFNLEFPKGAILDTPLWTKQTSLFQLWRFAFWRLNRLWNKSTTDAFVNQPTTISYNNANAPSNYDHFVYELLLKKSDPQLCSPPADTKGRFDYADIRITNPGKKPYAPIRAYLRSIKSNLIKQRNRMESARYLRFVRKAIQMDRYYPQTKVDEEISQHEQLMKYNPKAPYGRLHSLISDHLPIELECKR